MVNADDLDHPGSNVGYPRGIFTDADREFLEKDAEQRRKDYSHPARVQRRNAIQERLAFAMYDLSNSLYDIPKKVREETFEELFENWAPQGPPRLITDCIGFLLVSLMENMGEDMDDEETLELLLKRSIDRMLWASQYRVGVRSAEIDVDVTVDGWHSQKNIGDQIDPENMQPEWLHARYVTGEISQEEFARAVLSDELDDGD